MKVLTAVVCCDFEHYIRNMLESCIEFLPDTDLLVLDNSTSNAAIRLYLEERVRQVPRLRAVYRAENRTDRKVGSLYEAYNIAVEQALEGKYDVLCLQQDDFQVVWRDPDILARVERIFRENPKMVTLQTLFPRRGSHPMGLEARFRLDPGGEFYLSVDSGINDHGFYPVSFFRETGFRFGASEGDASKATRAAGWSGSLLRCPLVCAVPWPAVRRGGVVVGHERAPLGRYIIRPLGAADVARLVGRPETVLPWAEDYCFTQGYAALTPYCVTYPQAEFFGNLWRARKTRRWRDLFPHFETRGIEGRSSFALIRQISSLVGPHEPSLVWLTRLLVDNSRMGPLFRRIGAKLRSLWIVRAWLRLFRAPITRRDKSTDSGARIEHGGPSK